MVRSAAALALPITLAATLAACSTGTSAPGKTPPPAAEMEPTCGADKLVSYVGRTATADVLAEIQKTSGAKAMRVLTPDSMVTMDFRPDRLNVDVDANRVIKAFRCT